MPRTFWPRPLTLVDALVLFLPMLFIVTLILALLLAPVQAWAQATAATTLPRGIYEPSGRQQTPAQAVSIIGYDSVTDLPCIVGSVSTCQLAGAGGGGGGDATAARQDTGNLSLGAIDINLGAQAAATCATDTGTCALIQLVKRTNERLTSLLGSTDPVTVNPAATVTNGCTPGVYRSAASTNATNIKASAGVLCKLVLTNTTATVYWVRMYNLASAPTCSSGTGEVAAYPVPASTTGAGVAVPIGAFGEAYATGIGFCITGGEAATNTTNAATGVKINYSYK